MLTSRRHKELYISLLCDIGLRVMVMVTYISLSSDFTLNIEYYLLEKCHTWDISFM